MKKTIIPFVAGALVIAISASCTGSTENAQETTADSSGITSMASDSVTSMSQDPDAKLVYELIESMYAGIALMKDGEKKATNSSVKTLAAKLVTEHSKLTKDLEALSAKKNWPLPSGEPSADRQKREEMGKEEVSKFQKDWLAALRDRHETNIAKLENASPSDPDVKAAGEKGLPKIKMLLSNIKMVQTNLK